ncbi:hypothetical protein SAMN05444161_8727 [Rhizobiales bacterium GAS191]|nr:hypothetical protein SAMN05519103_08908 [Rhizobiales bacterium GAS113]SEF12265.1 hypothetical protein SAMN05444161_8727 [Rhizobiales bacterium GAS191]
MQLLLGPEWFHLMYDHHFNPQFYAIKGEAPFRWEVLVDWVSDRSEKLKGFVSKRDAEQWIKYESSDWALRTEERHRDHHELSPRD